MCVQTHGSYTRHYTPVDTPISWDLGKNNHHSASVAERPRSGSTWGQLRLRTTPHHTQGAKSHVTWQRPSSASTGLSCQCPFWPDCQSLRPRQGHH